MKIICWIILITTLSGVGGTGLGGIIGSILKRDSNKIVSLLLAFAGGVMLAVVCFDLLPSAFHPEGADHEMALWLVVAGASVGYMVIDLLNLLIDRRTNPEIAHIDQQHPKTADDLDELIHSDHYEKHKKNDNEKNHCQLFVAGVVMASAIALHNMPEGMVIGASYAKDAGDLFSGSGFLVAIVIGLHNIPEGMAVSVPLITGGMNKWKAIGVTAVSGLPTVIGAVIGYSIGLVSPVCLTLSLSFAGGAMLYVVFGELLPECYLMWKSKAPAAFAMIGTLVGMILVHI